VVKVGTCNSDCTISLKLQCVVKKQLMKTKFGVHTSALRNIITNYSQECATFIKLISTVVRLQKEIQEKLLLVGCNLKQFVR
jgi:hypothetical protein